MLTKTNWTRTQIHGFPAYVAMINGHAVEIWQAAKGEWYIELKMPSGTYSLTGSVPGITFPIFRTPAEAKRAAIETAGAGSRARVVRLLFMGRKQAFAEVVKEA